VSSPTAGQRPACSAAAIPGKRAAPSSVAARSCRARRSSSRSARARAAQLAGRCQRGGRGAGIGRAPSASDATAAEARELKRPAARRRGARQQPSSAGRLAPERVASSPFNEMHFGTGGRPRERCLSASSRLRDSRCLVSRAPRRRAARRAESARRTARRIVARSAAAPASTEPSSAQASEPMRTALRADHHGAERLPSVIPGTSRGRWNARERQAIAELDPQHERVRDRSATQQVWRPPRPEAELASTVLRRQPVPQTRSCWGSSPQSPDARGLHGLGLVPE